MYQLLLTPSDFVCTAQSLIACSRSRFSYAVRVLINSKQCVYDRTPLVSKTTKNKIASFYCFSVNSSEWTISRRQMQNYRVQSLKYWISSTSLIGRCEVTLWMIWQDGCHAVNQPRLNRLGVRHLGHFTGRWRFVLSQLVHTRQSATMFFYAAANFRVTVTVHRSRYFTAMNPGGLWYMLPLGMW